MMDVSQDMWESTVRNYEVDYQKIVNNANYFHYFDNARAIFLKKIGLDVNELSNNGINIVLVKTEIIFKKSLKHNDEFIVKTTLSRISRFKFKFVQEIFLKGDDNREVYAFSESVAASISTSGKPLIIDWPGHF
ncbi:MAG: thioesterase superfamily protein [Gammaproteobacteria bacterium]|jgi:acyl-CoA thioester hydrolase|nr:thioesterase superfamily protein [Gammaproteobacteria bacterium]